jgi:hypothetical protein
LQSYFTGQLSDKAEGTKWTPASKTVGFTIDVASMDASEFSVDGNRQVIIYGLP